MNYKNIALRIAQKINEKYSGINVYYDFYNDNSEIFIIIDNKKIYDSQEYTDMVCKISDEFSQINLFFSYLQSNEELTKNHVNLTLTNQEKYNTNSIKEISPEFVQIKILFDWDKFEIHNKNFTGNFKTSKTEKVFVESTQFKPFTGFLGKKNQVYYSFDSDGEQLNKGVINSWNKIIMRVNNPLIAA